MKRLLYITSQLPYPPYKGGVSTSWRVLKYLSEHFATTVLTLLKWDDEKHVPDFLNQIALEDFQGVSFTLNRTPGTIIKSYLKAVPINFIRNYHPMMEQAIQKRLHQADYILVDHYEMYQYLFRQKMSGKVILYEHNAEYMLWKRFSEVETNPLKKILTHWESLKIRKQERQFCEDADQVLAFPNDAKALQKLSDKPIPFTEILPCGEESLLEAPQLQWEETEESLLYVGALSWEANLDGLLWFISNVWPTLKFQRPGLVFYLVGAEPPERLVKMVNGTQGIVLKGFVEDLEPLYRKARVFIAPLRFGSGIKLKVLNALFRGIPVVTTPIGVEGLPLTSGKHIWIAKGTKEWEIGLTSLLTESSVWKKMGISAKKLSLEELAPAIQLKKIHRAILDL